MLQVINHTETCRCFRCVRTRLRNPPNGVEDLGIDLRRKKTVPVCIVSEQEPQAVPVTFVPPALLLDDADIHNIGTFDNEVVPMPSFRAVLRAVCKFYDVRPLDVLSQRREARVMRPRQVVYYLMYDLTNHTFPTIGRLMSRDHTSILSGSRKIARLLREDEKLRAEIDAIKVELLLS